MTIKEIDEQMKEVGPSYIEWANQIQQDDFDNGRIPTEETVGEGIGFERIRRITGYLVGDLNRFNNAKLAEVKDRVTHEEDHLCTEENTKQVQ